MKTLAKAVAGAILTAGAVAVPLSTQAAAAPLTASVAAAPTAHGMPSHRLQHDLVGYFGDLGRRCHDRDTDWRDRGHCRDNDDWRDRDHCRDNDWDRYRYTRREHCRNADWDDYRYNPYRYNGHHHDCGHWHR